MGQFSDMQLELQRRRQHDQDQDRMRRAADEADVVIETPRHLKLRSPNGTYFIISVDNAGVLSTTAAGTTL